MTLPRRFGISNTGSPDTPDHAAQQNSLERCLAARFPIVLEVGAST